MEILQIALIGLVAGVTPGPLLTLALSHVVAHDRREGVLTLLAPLITDLPIAALSIFLLSRLTYSNTILIIISFVGAVFILFLAVTNFLPKKETASSDAPKPRSLQKGIITNFMNPSVYIFWMTIGGKGFLDQWNKGPGWGILYLAVFYALNVGSSIALVFLADRFRGLLRSKGYRWALRILGLALVFFAGKIIWDAVGLIKN